MSANLLAGRDVLLVEDETLISFLVEDMLRELGAGSIRHAARLSIAYAPDSVKRLTDLVGPAHAKMILFTARRLTAEQAERIGLINECVPVEDLDRATMDLAQAIAENAPLSIRASKLTINEMLKDESVRNMAAIKEIGEICFNSADYKEGRTAFMEKRRPKFTGQ